MSSSGEKPRDLGWEGGGAVQYLPHDRRNGQGTNNGDDNPDDEDGVP
jgi:hypothetical protein